MKYLAIHDTQTKQNLEEANKIADLIYQYALNNIDNNELSIDRTIDIISNMLTIMKVEIVNKQEGFRIQQNLFMVFVKFNENMLQELFQVYYTKFFHNMYNIEDILNILNNFIDYAYTQQSAIFIDLICKRYEYEQRYDLLFDIYIHFIKPKLLPQLRNPKCVQYTYELVKNFILGFQYLEEKNCIFDQQNLKQMITNTKFLRFIERKQQIQEVYDLYLFISQHKILLSGKNTKQEIKDFQIALSQIQKQYDLQNKSGQFQQWQNQFFVKSIKDIKSPQDIQLPTPVNYQGLHNIGNTCYMNSFIQCLFMNKDFRQYIILEQQKLNPKILLSQNSSFEELTKLFYGLLNGDQPQEPYTFKKSLPLPFNESFDQQDPGEFAAIYLDFLEDYQKSINKNNQNTNQPCENKLKDLMFGQVTSQIKCTGCKKNYQRKEDFSQLSLIFSQLTLNKETGQNSLKEMLRQYFCVEQLMGDNQYYCDVCNDYKNASKEILIDKFPPYLMLTLNRYDPNDPGFKKKDQADIPFEFDLKEFFPELRIKTQQGCNYQLYAFIVHLGQSINAGHYIAYGRDLQNPNSWINFDDTFVNTHKNIKTMHEFQQNWSEFETPYILFYANDTQKHVDLNQYTRKTSLIQSGMKMRGSQLQITPQ